MQQSFISKAELWHKNSLVCTTVKYMCASAMPFLYQQQWQCWSCSVCFLMRKVAFFGIKKTQKSRVLCACAWLINPLTTALGLIRGSLLLFSEIGFHLMNSQRGIERPFVFSGDDRARERRGKANKQRESNRSIVYARILLSYWHQKQPSQKHWRGSKYNLTSLPLPPSPCLKHK